MLFLQFSLYPGSDEYFVGPIRRRITDKAPMSLPSGRRRDLSQKSKEGSLKHVITIRAEYILSGANMVFMKYFYTKAIFGV